MNTVAYDPFERAPLWVAFTRMRRSWISLGGALLVFAAVLASLASGTLGTLSDVQIIADIRRTFSLGDPPPSSASFPLLRDVASWYLAAVIIYTWILVQEQWRLMRIALGDLLRTGVLRPSPSTISPDGESALTGSLSRTQTGIRIAHLLQPLALAAAIAAMAFLVTGEKENGLFRVLMPDGLSQSEQHQWLQDAYASWWAGSNHPLGLGVYFVFGTLGLYIIILQNIIGFLALGLVRRLRRVAVLDADWLNRDGRYGWLPIARVFRTVYWSLIVHGAAVALVVIVLGVENFAWIWWLVALWTAVVVLYTVVPWLVFRRVETGAKQRRIQTRIEHLHAAGLDASSPAPDLLPYEAEIRWTHQARIRPLRVRAWSAASLGAVVILPLVLAAGQTAFAWLTPN